MKKSLLVAMLALVSVVALAQTPRPVSDMMMDAQKTAKAQGKSVMVVFHASWCGWCKKFEAFMAMPEFKPLFDKSFVIVRVDVLESPDKKNLENPGGDEILKALGGDNQGIPYFAVVDANGKALVDSRRIDPKTKEGHNIGHPAAPEEVEHFMNMLKKTTKLSATELGSIETFLKKQK
jgi:thioredoxin-related protein